MKTTAKDEVRSLLEKLPDDASLNDIQYHIYVRQKIGRGLEAIRTGNVIPNNSVEVTVPRLILGVAKTFDVWRDKISIMPELNVITTFDGKRNTLIKSNAFSMDPVMGLEIGYLRMIYLRGGIYNIQQVTDIKNKTSTVLDPCIGVGIKYKIFTLDYALTSNVTLGLYSNIFSVKINIDKGMLPKQN